MPSGRGRGQGVRDAANPQYPASAYLLDVNVLIALLDPLHTLHARAHAWFKREVRLWASCPLTENGTLRIMTHPSYTNPMESVAAAGSLLGRLCAHMDHQFWPCDESLLDSAWVDMRCLLGHAQITDTCLLAMAAQRGGKLATFDRRLVTTAVKHGKASLCIID